MQFDHPNCGYGTVYLRACYHVKQMLQLHEIITGEANECHHVLPLSQPIFSRRTIPLMNNRSNRRHRSRSQYYKLPKKYLKIQFTKFNFFPNYKLLWIIFSISREKKRPIQYTLVKCMVLGIQFFICLVGLLPCVHWPSIELVWTGQ